MKKMKFDRKLHSFLVQKGFTHIYNLGIVVNSDERMDEDNFILIPLKPDDPRLSFEENEVVILEINDKEVLDMADGDEFISFFVEIPEPEYEDFLIHK